MIVQSSLSFALLSSVVACAVDAPTTSSESHAEVETGDLAVWRQNYGTLSMHELITNVKQLAADLPADGRTTRTAIQDGLRDLAGQVLALDGLVGLYLHEVIALEKQGLSLDRLRPAYDRTVLAKYLELDAFGAKRRVDGQVVIEAEVLEDAVGTITYTGLEVHGSADYDDDGDLDLFLVNAPGGDNALRPSNNYHQLACPPVADDVDGDGELDLLLTAVPQPAPPVVVSLITPATR